MADAALRLELSRAERTRSNLRHGQRNESRRGRDPMAQRPARQTLKRERRPDNYSAGGQGNCRKPSLWQDTWERSSQIDRIHYKFLLSFREAKRRGTCCLPGAAKIRFLASLEMTSTQQRLRCAPPRTVCLNL